VTVYRIDPISDPRWAQLLLENPRASIFHTPGWLDAIRRTYGYEPFVFTTSRPGTCLDNGIAFCSIDSWATGRRLVGLPFSDHCELLISNPADVNELSTYLERELTRSGWDYIEIRPLKCDWSGLGSFQQGQTFYVHQLDLTQSVESLWQSFAKDSVRRKIQRQKREGLRIEQGSSELLLDHFYRLFVRTRRRHRLPPPPRSWFSNLIGCLAGSMTIRVCYKADLPIASIVTLQYNDMLVYKYGCSDERFHSLGGMQALLWSAIQSGKAAGLHTFDLGRTDCENRGLVRFKNGWGATCSKLTYFVYPDKRLRRSYGVSTVAKRVLSWMPRRVLTAVGGVIYKHIG